VLPPTEVTKPIKQVNLRDLIDHEIILDSLI
jgi:hypothetical protein